LPLARVRGREPATARGPDRDPATARGLAGFAALAAGLAVVPAGFVVFEADMVPVALDLALVALGLAFVAVGLALVGLAFVAVGLALPGLVVRCVVGSGVPPLPFDAGSGVPPLPRFGRLALRRCGRVRGNAPRTSDWRRSAIEVNHRARVAPGMEKFGGHG
jgi:hypothetical protein